MQPTVMDPCELAACVRSRLFRLMQDVASVHWAKGYAILQPDESRP